MRFLPILGLLLFTVGAFAQLKIPNDIHAFVDRRDGCDHFRGEPWDLGDDPVVKERREFIFRQINTLCRGTDKQLTGLRKKYAKNNDAVQKLVEYEDGLPYLLTSGIRKRL
jgi:hypothetical protein